MAIKWGSWSSGQSGSKSRLGIDRSTSTTASQITVAITVYVEFSGYYANSSGTLTLSGGHSVTKSVSLVFSGSGTRNLGTYSQTFTRPWGSASSQKTYLSISGFAGGSPRTEDSYTLPRRLYSAPPAPSSVTASWVRDGVASLAWSITGSTSAPVPSVEIVRQSNNNSWGTNASTINKRSGSTTFSNLSRGNRYRWRVRGKNQDATGAWGYSGWVYMRPNDVANVVATRSGANINLTWVNRDALDYAGYRVYDNGTLVGTVSAGTTSFTHTAPDPARTHRYSVRAYYGSLEAAHVYSNTVQLLAPPLAPTNLSPDGGYRVAATSVPLSWTHNSVDGSDQTAYELQARRAGTTTWTTYTGTTATSRNISVSTFASSGQEIEWRVRTKGDHATYGPYSAVSSFEVASRPTVSISAPAAGATIEGAYTPLTFTISRTPASYRVELLEGNTRVQTIEDYAASSPVTVQLTHLQDGQSYTARVTATEKVESTTVTRSFSVAYAQPATPTIQGTWDVDRGAAVLTVQRTAGTPTTTQVRIEHWDGMEWVPVETVAVGVSPITAIVDHARLDLTTYRAVGLATVGGSIVESTPSEALDLGVFPRPANFLNFGNQVVQLRYRPGLGKAADSSDLALVYLDDGTADPVAIFGPKEHHTATLDGILVDEAGNPAREQAVRFGELARWKDLVLLRTIDAAPVWGVVSNVQVRLEQWGGYFVSLTHTKAR